MASVRSERVVNADGGTGLFKGFCALQFHFAVLGIGHRAFAERIVHAELEAFVIFVTCIGSYY